MKLVFTRKTAIISSIIVLVVALGVLFYINKNKSQPNDDATQDQISETENVQESSDVSNSPENNGNKGDAVITVSNDFGNAMQKAQTAFGSGDYTGALTYYNQALTYSAKSDLPYSGMFVTYSAQGEWVKARTSLDKAIEFNPLNTDYWNWKLTLLDEKTATSFAELKKIYEEGMGKSTPKARINLVIHFAAIATANNEKSEAITLWEKAIQLNPTMKATYQAEIDVLKK